MRKTQWFLLLTALLLLICGMAAADGENLLANPSFEELDSDGLPVGWYTDAYINDAAYTLYTTSREGEDGGTCAVIYNFGANDARFAQDVEVEPDSLYRLSGYLRADVVEDIGWGANLSVEGVYLDVDSWFSSDGEWVYTEMYGETDADQTVVTVFARLGGYSGESEGTAWFDNLSLVKVDEVPEGAVCQLWYTEPYDSSDAYDYSWDDGEEEETASAFWPWLLALSALYLALGFLMAFWLLPKASLKEEKPRMPLWCALGLVLAFAVRYFVALRVDGYQVDVNCFLAWGSTMANAGPTGFYASTSFCDYPPAYMLVLGLTEQLARLLTSAFGGVLPTFLRREILIKLLPMLCDLGLAELCRRVARDHGCSRLQSGLICLLVAFCPVLILNSAAWCQVDSVLTLLLCLTVWLALKHRWDIALPVYMLAVLTKPQALMAGPLGLLALGMEWLPGFKKPACLKKILTGLGAALGVALVIVLPFAIGQGGISWLIDKYAETLSSYPYATVNTANLYYLFSGNWSAIANTSAWGAAVLLACIALGWGVGEGLLLRRKQRAAWWLEPALMACFTLFFAVCAVLRVSWTVLGTGAMVLAFAVTMPLLLRSGTLKALPLLGGALFVLLYVLGIKMHERYLFPALVLLAMAFAIRRDGRLLAVLLLLSCTMFVNEGIVLDNSVRLGSSYGHLNNDTYGLNMLLSVLNVCSVPLLLWAAADLCLCPEKEARPLPLFFRKKDHAASPLEYQSTVSLHWTKKDTLLMLSVTLIYAVVALCNLGSTKAPQTTWVSTSADEQVVLDLGQEYEDFAMVYYCEVSYNDFSVAVSSDGENWSQEYWAEMKEGCCYQWKYLMPSYESNGSVYYSGGSHLEDIQRLSGRYVRVSAQQVSLKIGELIFRDADGNGITATVVSHTGGKEASPLYSDPQLMVDEPDSLEGEPSWYNGTYFDEIYYARTAKELLEGSSPYEWTHPPLGKVLMSWCVALLGMTPFAWRLAGALMGIFMLPAMYVFGKQLTKRTGMAFAACTMMALDCMHYTQTRLTTIDSFPVCFIILSFLFMARFMQRDILREPLRKVLPDLGLSGLFIALAIASKWIGLYAGVGLAVLYFWTLLRHLRMSHEGLRLLDRSDLTEEQRTVLTERAAHPWKRALTLCLWCVLFFVVVPVTVYLLVYIPFMTYAHPKSLGEFIQLVIQQQQSMYSYHSTPGLGMDHAFYSPWYEWPLIQRPMYYYSGEYMPEGYNQSIFSFGNPAVWLVGLLGIAVTVVLWARQHIFRAEGSPTPVHLYGRSWNVAAAVILIALLAEFLPWVLVPRGTYIYHYFASVPFLILGTMMALHTLTESRPKLGHWVTGVYLVLVLACFIVFYPYASGVPTPLAWLDFAKQFLRIYYIQ